MVLKISPKQYLEINDFLILGLWLGESSTILGQISSFLRTQRGLKKGSSVAK